MGLEVKRMKKTVLTKEAIREIARRYRESDPDVAAAAAMAEEYRKIVRQGKKPKKKRRPKKQLKPTDHLSLEQVARIMTMLAADAAQADPRYAGRAILNEMLVLVMLESGLRVAEVSNLRLKSLPSYHCHQVIEVLNGKGEKDRTVGISDFLSERLRNYVEQHHKGHSIESFLFKSENAGKLSTASVYAKTKVIGLRARIWLYLKNGQMKTKLSPHKFRHTNATHLLDVTGNQGLVQDQLGHEDARTTRLYARTLMVTTQPGMNAFSKRIRAQVEDQSE